MDAFLETLRGIHLEVSPRGESGESPAHDIVDAA
jgi:hypothetical protein